MKAEKRIFETTPTAPLVFCFGTSCFCWCHRFCRGKESCCISGHSAACHRLNDFAHRAPGKVATWLAQTTTKKEIPKQKPVWWRGMRGIFQVYRLESADFQDKIRDSFEENIDYQDCLLMIENFTGNFSWFCPQKISIMFFWLSPQSRRELVGVSWISAKYLCTKSLISFTQNGVSAPPSLPSTIRVQLKMTLL